MQSQDEPNDIGIGAVGGEDVTLKYGMSNQHRGLAVIIDNRIIADNEGELMKEVFSELKFTILDNKVHRRLKKQQMIQVLLRASSHEDNSDCFCCVVLSYGDEGSVFGADDDNNMRFDEFFAPFKGDNCEKLIGKPKLFFIQTCDEPLESDFHYESGGMIYENDEEHEYVTLPTEADFFLASWFVPDSLKAHNKFLLAIKTVFVDTEMRQLDLLSMMTRVNRIVSDGLQQNSKVFEELGNKIPCITSKLTKELKFQ